MEYVTICTVAVVVSALTLFSGFGLGTLLMPAFALFFPINVAVAGMAVVSAVIVDVSRLAIYGVTFFGKHFDIINQHGEAGLITAGILSAWLGTLIGIKLLKKITIKTLQVIVGVMLLFVAAALALGFI